MKTKKETKLTPQINTILEMVLILCCIVFIGLCKLITVRCIPVKYLNENLRESCEIFQKEGAYPNIILQTLMYNADYETTSGKVLSYAMLDNYTDASMLLFSEYDEDGSLITNTLLNPYHKNPGELPTEAFINTMNNESERETKYYARYWMGFLTYLRPMLLLMNYEEIRLTLGIVEYLLIALIGFFCIKRDKTLYCVPVIVSFCFLIPQSISKSMQFSAVFFITFLQLLIILIKHDMYTNKKIWLYHFLIFGSLTSYIDLLTYPLVSFGIPFLLLISFYNMELKESILDLIRSGLSWLMGYIGMWASKWILASILTDTNVIRDAYESIVFRIQGDYGEYNHKDILNNVISRNINMVDWLLPILIIGIVICIIMAFSFKQLNLFIIYILNFPTCKSGLNV